VGNHDDEVHLKAQLLPSWHIFSQNMPMGGPLPTRITFFYPPSTTLKGELKEAGKWKQRQEPFLNADVRYYENEVEFIQQVQLYGQTQKALQVGVSYQVCNDWF
jgi:thiol:disulfide interchange protein DsbD